MRPIHTQQRTPTIVKKVADSSSTSERELL